MAKDIKKSKAATAKDNGKAQKSGDNASTDRRILVHAQYIKDLSFENQNSPDSLSSKGEAPAINVDINVYAKPLRKKIYEVSLSINSKAEKENFKVE